MMKLKTRWLAVAFFGFATAGQAQTFEGSGLIQNIDLDRNIIQVGDERYQLPNSTQLDGSPALPQLREGQTANFSGTDASPLPVIESIYVYPDMPQGRHGDFR